MDYVAQSLALLMEQYKNLVNVPGVVTALAKGDQVLEDTLQAVLAQRNINAAVGAQLDGIGELVGQPRGGMLDVQYRIVIYAKIGADNSNGTAEDLIALYSTLMGSPVILTEYFPASVSLEAVEPAPIGALSDIKNAMLRIKAGGVSLFLAETDGDPIFATLEDSGPNLSGAGDLNDPSLGGILSSLL